MLLFAVGLASWANAAQPVPGSLAPAFRLPDQNGKLVSLADQRGKWVVLYFYPKDNTPGCTTEACDFRDNSLAFRDLGAVVLGISVDSIESHRGFAAEHHLPFTILADSAKVVSKGYGVLHRPLGLMEVARRETFIVDPEGRIAKHYPDVDPERHSKQVLADLKALQEEFSRRQNGRTGGAVPGSPHRALPASG
ncbi:MAG TPA: peroxiredoxin [Steroidobacteraceae bacterium]